VEQLIDASHDVAVFDNLTEGHRKAIDPRSEFVEGDLADREGIAGAMSRLRPDAVMHFAANALVGESMQNPSKYFRNNVSGGIHLLDALIASAQKEVDARQPERGQSDRKTIATQIAIGALRYFMLKFTKNAVIAFDFKDALSFEGETGPYVQYAVVRAASIFRKSEMPAERALEADLAWTRLLDIEDDVWELWVTAGKLSLLVDQCIATTEPAYLAKYAFQVAQMFNNFYHRHHILTEQNRSRKSLLLSTAAVVQRELVRTLSILGIDAPEAM
jgi:arginyl-tRNA synthetase